MMLTVTSVSNEGDVLSTSVPLPPSTALALCNGILSLEGHTPIVHTEDGTRVPPTTLLRLVFEGE